MAERIFAPLRMAGTTAGRPTEANVAEHLARGYRWIGGSREAVTSRFSSANPSGSITTTAADMARFMIALVGDGSVDDGRILPDDVVQRLFAPQYSPDPRIRSRGYAFLEWSTRGRRLYHHDGTLGDHIGMLMVSPGDRFGVFVASNGAPPEGASIGNLLLEPMLTLLAGPATAPPPPPEPPPDAALRARRVAGTYRDYRHTRNDMARLMTLMPMIQTRLTVEADGAIRWRGHRWVEVAPLVFRSTDPPDYSADGPDHIVFRENERGEIAELHAWGATYERIGWTEQAPFHLALFASCVIAFLGYGTVRGLRELRRRTAMEDGMAARRCALFVSLMNVGFVVGIPIFFNSLRTSTPLSPPILALWLALPLASVGVTALLPGFAMMAWRERWWTRGERLWFSTLAALSVAFMAFLNYWKLLTIPY